MIFGVLHTLTGGWDVSIWLSVLLLIPELGCGLVAFNGSAASVHTTMGPRILWALCSVTWFGWSGPGPAESTGLTGPGAIYDILTIVTATRVAAGCPVVVRCRPGSSSCPHRNRGSH